MPKIEVSDNKGLIQKTGTGYSVYGVDLAPNDILTTVLGLQPTWRLNFGGAALAAASNTGDDHLLDVLTPVNTLLRMSLALSKVASQGTAITANQAEQIFGATANAGTIQDMTGVTAISTNLIPATLTPITITGRTAANLTLNASATDLASNDDQVVLVFNDYIIENSHFLKITLHTNNGLHAASCEAVTTGNGTNVLTRATAASDDDVVIILTATGDTTILPGSFIYLQAGNNTDDMNLKMCLRVSGGTIAPTFGT